MESVVFSGDHVTVYDYSVDPSGIHGVCAEADLIDGIWWICRVLVKKEQDRGKGLGSKFLQKLLFEIYRRDPDAAVVVSPGGYGVNSKKQINFYKKNGFKLISDSLFQHKKG